MRKKFQGGLVVRRAALVIGMLFVSIVLMSLPAIAEGYIGPLKITEVYVDFGTNTIVISGQNFDNGNTPVVLLGDNPVPLTLVGTPTANEIIAELPAVPDGDYLLKVNTISWAQYVLSSQFFYQDVYNLTIGAVVKEGQVNSITSVMIQNGQVGSDDINQSEVQRRINGNCDGQVMVSVNETGTPNCEEDDVGVATCSDCTEFTNAIAALQKEVTLLKAQAGNVKLVFVTSATHNGTLGGLSGADTTCQSLATAAGLPGTYKAWLSSTTTSASSRLTHSSVPYVLVDGTIVADNWADLTDGNLLNQINRSEDGLLRNDHVWTNTREDGTDYTSASTDTCINWTSSSGGYIGLVGRTTEKNSQWTRHASQACHSGARIYCFQQ